jgi:hypothetical protein
MVSASHAALRRPETMKEELLSCAAHHFQTLISEQIFLDRKRI